MEAYLLSRRDLIFGVAAKGAEHILNHHPASRALRYLAEGEPPCELRIIQTGIEQIEVDDQDYRIKANPEAIAGLTQYLADTFEPPIPRDIVEEQFRNAPLQINIEDSQEHYRRRGAFAQPSLNLDHNCPRIDIGHLETQRILKEQQSYHDPSKLHPLPHELVHYLEWIEDPDKFNQQTKVRAATGLSSIASGAGLGIKGATYEKGANRKSACVILGTTIGTLCAPTLIGVVNMIQHDRSHSQIPNRLCTEPELYDLTTRTFDFELIE
jgi:hypothetical protein